MTDTFFKELKEDLMQGAATKEHPFHYCTMGTVGLEYLARLRTLKLRKVSNDLKLTFYTDKRSKKILHIKENPKVGLLFYHPQKLLQLKIEGLATIIKDQESLSKHWKNVHPGSRKDYTTTTAPGSAIKSPDTVEFLEDENYFCMVEVNPFKIEYLKLKHPNHLRIRFSKKNDSTEVSSVRGWKGEFLVP